MKQVCENIHRSEDKEDKLDHHCSTLSLIVIFTLFAILILPLSASGANQPLAVPAEFVQLINTPGQTNNFVRPAAILSDRVSGEIYVVDRGNNRIAIFNVSGVFQFEFSTLGYCSGPTEIAVNENGIIYVLGSTAQGKGIYIFDYDGKFIRQFSPNLQENNSLDLIKSIAVYEKTLYVLESNSKTIFKFDENDQYIKHFATAETIEDDLKNEIIFGSLFIDEHSIYLPISSFGSVYRYSHEGEYIGSIGHQGTTMSELAFPIGVTSTTDGIIVILDKHRFTAVCFNSDGKFLGEFGGKGMRQGWFYHPTRISADSKNQIYIGQVYNNMVQVLNLPEFIIERNKQFNKKDELDENARSQSDGEAFNRIGTELKSGDYKSFGSANSVSPNVQLHNRQDLVLLNSAFKEV